jgi:Tfp pilus assembly protein PilP
MKKSLLLLVVLLVAIIFVVGCTSSKTTAIRSFRADQDSTWKATLRAVKEFTGQEPQSVDEQSRTIVVKGSHIESKMQGSNLEKKTMRWNAVISVNLKDLNVYVGDGLAKQNGLTWIVIKTNEKTGFTTSSENTMPKDGRESSQSFGVTNDSSLVDKFARAIQRELGNANFKPADLVNKLKSQDSEHANSKTEAIKN